MLIKEECLQLIANQRTDEVVVTTMGITVPWGKYRRIPWITPLSVARWTRCRLCTRHSTRQTG